MTTFSRLSQWPHYASVELKRTPRHSAVETIAVEISGLPGFATVVRSARRQRTIAISVEAGAVSIRAPMRVSRSQLVEALRARREWIIGRLSEPVTALAPKLFATGDMLPYLGRDFLLEVRETHRQRTFVRLESDALVVEAPATATASERADAIQAALIRWYRVQAGEVIREAVGRWSAHSGLAPKAVLVRDQRRRWGSCGPDGTLRFNWRLVMAEPNCWSMSLCTNLRICATTTINRHSGPKSRTSCRGTANCGGGSTQLRRSFRSESHASETAQL